MDVGSRIKQLRLAENISQNALAEKANISQTHLRRVELGQAGITVEHLQLICNVFNISLAQFFAENDTQDELGSALSKLTPKQKAKLIDFIDSL